MNHTACERARLFRCPYRVSDEVYRGVASAVERRWRKLRNNLNSWDSKLTKLLCTQDWRKRNRWLSDISGDAEFAIPVLVTPRVEWIPGLDDELLLLPARLDLPGIDGFGVPRICTFEDIRRLITAGGPSPSMKVNWIFELGQ